MLSPNWRAGDLVARPVPVEGFFDYGGLTNEFIVIISHIGQSMAATKSQMGLLGGMLDNAVVSYVSLHGYALDPFFLIACQ